MLANTAKNELIERGFSLSNNVTGADFIVQIQGATREAGTAQGFHKCYLDMEIEVIHASSGQVIYQKTETNIKGLQMDYQTAGMEAYKKGVKLIKSTWGKEFTKQLM